MGMGLGIVFVLSLFVIVGFLVIQARFAARAWRRVIAAGDRDALGRLIEMTFEGWRNARPPRGVAPADWRALHTAALIAADRRCARVSLLAEPDVQVIGGRRVEVGSAQDVARRAAVRMVELLMYEVPHVSFEEVQVDVHTEYRSAEGAPANPCLLTTRATREAVAYADWETRDAAVMLAEWQTREAGAETLLDPERDALLPAPSPEASDAIAAAERALRARRP